MRQMRAQIGVYPDCEVGAAKEEVDARCVIRMTW